MGADPMTAKGSDPRTVHGSGPMNREGNKDVRRLGDARDQHPRACGEAAAWRANGEPS
jgi:hypothetical protein